MKKLLAIIVLGFIIGYYGTTGARLEHGEIYLVR